MNYTHYRHQWLHIAKTIIVYRYMIRKIIHQVHVDEIEESLWEQLSKKCGFGMLNEGYCEKILK